MPTAVSTPVRFGHLVRWQADTGTSISMPAAFERAITSVFDATAALFSIGTARLPSHEDVFTRPAVPDARLEDQLVEVRGQLDVVRVRYSNPLVIDVGLIGASAAAVTAAVGIGTFLLTGAAARKKILAEARKTTAEAQLLENKLREATSYDATRRDTARQLHFSPQEEDMFRAWKDAFLLIHPESVSQAQFLAYLQEHNRLRARLIYLKRAGFTLQSSLGGDPEAADDDGADDVDDADGTDAD